MWRIKRKDIKQEAGEYYGIEEEYEELNKEVA